MSRTTTAAAPAGTFIGTVDPDGGAIFAGIPFAQPPIGELRFRPPVPPPDADGLFAKAIMSSGNTGRIIPAETATAVARELCENVGVTSMAELQAVDAERILEAQFAVVDSDLRARNLPGGHVWAFVLDGHVLPEHTVLAGGGVTDISLLVGASRHEAEFFRVFSADSFVSADEDAVLTQMIEALVSTHRLAQT